MFKKSTAEKLLNELQKIADSGLTISVYLKSIGKDTNNISARINQFKQDPKNLEEYPEILPLYENLKLNNKVSYKEEIETSCKWWCDRNDEGIITQYHVQYARRDTVPFFTTLTRQDVETLYGLYTYYGGNVTARNVTSEFAKYTLDEIKMIFRCFRLTKNSCWAAPHLMEELNTEQLSQYRMALKERAAFKYCDAQQERDFSNQIKRMASKIKELTDRNEIAKELIGEVEYEKVFTAKSPLKGNNVGIICLSDLHIGAFNTPEGYLTLPEYNESEINRRLDKIVDFVSSKKWSSVVVLNLGDNIDSYKKMTTSMTHTLPCVMTDKEISKMYISIMMRFFGRLSSLFDDVSYYSIGSGNHSGHVGWLCDVVLAHNLEDLGIDCHICDNEIDVVNVNNTSFLFLHGKAEASKGQFKGFPLNLNDKTQCWFNDFFADTDLPLLDRKVVLKGDLHQFSVNSVSSFDYINCPSIYGSSTYIVSNFGLTPSGCAYLEVDETGNYSVGVINNLNK